MSQATEYGSDISFEAPRGFTALTFTETGLLLAGGEDGTLRVYDLSPSAQRALCKAINGLPDEVSSICCQPSKLPPVAAGKAWVASGKQILLFDLTSDKLLIGSQEAEEVVTLIEGNDAEDNVLNQKIGVSKDMIVYSCDSGAVGVYDIQTKKRRVMKAMHSSVSCCHQYTLLVIDCSGDGAAYPLLDMWGAPVSLAPPFLYSVTINSNGVFTAGTADGNVLVGRGGERGRRDRPNRRKWNGLSADMVSQYHIAEGPVIGVAWVGSSELMSVTLLGQVKHLRLPEPQKRSHVLSHTDIETLWETRTTKVDKVESLAVFETPEHVLHIAIGGLTSTGRGCIEIWKRPLKSNTEL
ncbi:WD40 domain-containing protein [Rhizoctonia solani AG-1 IA]|uniref:WD40 domain-containing protein n=1 Tax=Thanatephorus cucumeris (strain AG1-IA) TaxID=983506 RepID=L8X7G0_THACA|nr:WD40 domain-containing protein [Rhizoctonia solani AG-1 IA]